MWMKAHANHAGNPLIFATRESRMANPRPITAMLPLSYRRPQRSLDIQGRCGPVESELARPCRRKVQNWLENEGGLPKILGRLGASAGRLKSVQGAIPNITDIRMVFL